MHDLSANTCGKQLAASPVPVPPSAALLREDFTAVLSIAHPASRASIDRLHWLIDEHEKRTAPVNFAGAKFVAEGPPRSVDDALDAAGALHHDERGSLSTAQRVAWLARQRDKSDYARSERSADQTTILAAHSALLDAGVEAYTLQKGIRELAGQRDTARRDVEKGAEPLLEMAKRPLHQRIAALESDAKELQSLQFTIENVVRELRLAGTADYGRVSAGVAALAARLRDAERGTSHGAVAR
jgi:hypothetical protein